MVSPDVGPTREFQLLEQSIKSNGFSDARFLRRGASGVAFKVTDERSGQVALLKLAPASSGREAVTLMDELNVLVCRSRRDADGLGQVIGYPLGQVPEGVVLEPTMRGTAKIPRRTDVVHVDNRLGTLLEWIEEAETGQPGYHRLDRLIPEWVNTWSDLEILDIVAPFAYLLAQAHKKRVIYNDIGADKADHLYYDVSRHQLKVIDWANVVFMRDADYRGARRPLHDVRGLARLIYRMRTNADPNEIERNASAGNFRDDLIERGHPQLAELVYKCLINNTARVGDPISADQVPITNGEQLYQEIEKTITTLRGIPNTEPRPRLVLRRSPEQRLGGLRIGRPSERLSGKIIVRRPRP